MVYEPSKMIPNHSSCWLIEDQLLFQLEKFLKKKSLFLVLDMLQDDWRL